MTQTLTDKKNKLLHVARVQLPKKGLRYLLLRQVDPNRLSWYELHENGDETPLDVSGVNVEDALRIANSTFKDVSFRMVGCGYRYTLPERDEHGTPALFHQMVSSLQTMNGVYFDPELGHNCYVQAASDEAIGLMKRFLIEGKL